MDEAVLLLAKERGLTPQQMADAIRSYSPAPVASTSTLRQRIDEFIDHQRDVMKRADRTIKNLRWKLGPFARASGGLPAALVRPEDLLAVLEAIPDMETRRSHYLGATVFFGWLTRRGFVSVNPMRVPGRHIEPIEVPYKAPIILTLEEEKALLDASSGETRALLALKCFAGIRSIELFSESWGRPRLQWEDFDWKEGVIHIRREVAKGTRKKDNERWVPINDALRAWIPAADRKKAGPVASRTQKYIFDDFRALLIKANEKLEKKLREWPDNGPRHSFASYFLAAYPERGAAELARIMGNSETVALGSYVKSIKRQTGGAWFALRP
ncbi:hypothetical protein [Verrucomicrobium sp. GAS474]|uniref:tyrosine-type recombinase/integrase n=1 Tax=Verrucomicrobium sp. GAS474 TaxID=1882831 RepID=UPI0012FF6DE0|nr:hypothetical protein [Verrucomicrobium sp. GAS474]